MMLSSSGTSWAVFATLLVGLFSLIIVRPTHAQERDSTAGVAPQGPSLDPDSMQAIVNSHESRTIRSPLSRPKGWSERSFARSKSFSKDESIGNRGTEFWLLMERNFDGTEIDNEGDQFVDITSQEVTSGTVEIEGLGYSKGFTTTPGEVTRIRLPDDAEIESSEEVKGKGIHVTAENPVTVYGLSRADATTDGYLGLPVSVLSTNYLVASYPSLGSSNNNGNLSQFALASPRDGVSVTITPSAATLGGRSAGEAFTVELDQGEVYQVRSEAVEGPDLTGSVVQASSPVALFSGHSCANVPTNVSYCDILIEQIPPTDTWGSNFVTRPLEGRENGDTFRILSGQEGTTVEINGESVATLGFGDYHETILKQPSVITASNPVLVMQYSNGDEWDPTINANGDPFMMMVPPSEQFSRQYAFATPNEGFSLNYVNLAVPSDATGSILVDGSPVESNLFETVGGSDFSVAAVDVELGSHTSESTSDTQFGIYSYGFEDDDSYGFTGGLTLDFISEGSAPEVTRTPETIELEEEEIAGGQSITISAEITDPAPPPAQSATVFYRNTEGNTYSPVSMSNTEGDIWEGAIPGESVSDPGIEYYISATDGQLTGTSPQVNPSGSPHSFGVLPNKTPTIEHTPISVAPPDEDLTVEASATDENDQVSSVELLYRQVGGNPAYTTLEMQEDGNTYEATIPEGDVTEQGVEYYIRATDSFGVSATEPIGAPDDPIEVSISDDPFADWPNLDDPSITLKIVQPDPLDIAKVQLVGENKSILKSAPVLSGFAEFPTPEPINNRFTEIRLLNQEDQVLGYLPFKYTQLNYEEPFGIDAVVYIHNEEALQPELNTDRWSDEWDYYDVPDVENPYPLSMLVPPGGEINTVELDDRDPVVLVHGVSGRYPSWGNDIGQIRDLIDHLDDEDYAGWQFYYPENQNITKSGPLLAKAVHRLQNNLGYGEGQTFNIVAHSMGGLVSRHYVQRMGIGSDRYEYSEVLDFVDPTPRGNVDKFLMLGTPNHGSYAAFDCTEGAFTKCGDHWPINKDEGAPAYRQMTPGSRFLSDLESSGAGVYSSNSTLVVAGTENSVGVPPILEIPNQDDGVVAVSSASLLNLSVPLAVGDFLHTDGLNLSPFGIDITNFDVLNEDTKSIINDFLNGDYGPDIVEGSEGNGITGYWSGDKGGEESPSPSEEEGLSINTEEGILSMNLKGADIESASLVKCYVIFGGPCLRLGGSEIGLEKVPNQSRFFTFADASMPGIFPTGITVSQTIGFDIALNGLDEGENTVKVQARGLFGVWSDIDEVEIQANHLQTNQVDLLINEEEELVAVTNAFTPSVGAGSSEGTSVTTSSPATLNEHVNTDAEFLVDAATDTLSFWATQDSTGDFSDHNTRLVAPDGTVIDSTTAKAESDLGYTQNLEVGSVIYVVEDPEPGRWTVRHDPSVRATVSAPVRSTVDLRASTPDSVFSTGEAVPVEVSFSDRNTYENTDIDAQLRVEDPEDGTVKKLGRIELTESTATTYEGTFIPSYAGSHQVLVDFSARVDGESVLRRTVESVLVVGDSTETAPDPPPAPSELAVEFNRSGGVTIDWSPPGSGTVNEYRIYRDTIPNPIRQVATVSSGQTTYTDSEARRGRTYYYRITAAGTEGVESVYTDASSIFAYPSSLPVQIERTFGDAEAEEDYRLVALPGQASGSLSESVSGDWRGFREEGRSEDQPYSRSECEGDCQFGPGEGFWLITDQSWEVSRTVNTVPLSEAKTAQIDLQEGWNIVSNPFGEEVAWNRVQVATGTSQPLWQWDGSWSRVQTFAAATAGEAYYFRSDSLSQLTVPYPVPEAVPQTKADTAENEGQTLTLSAVRGDRRLSTVEAGVRPDAKDGLDAFDQYGPPGYFGEATLRLIQNEDGRRRVLATEYTAPDEEGTAFDLVLQAKPDTVVTLQAGGLEDVAEGEVVLVNRATGESHNLAENREPVIVPQSRKTPYRLLVGSRSFVKENQQAITPESVKLLANYPNPFRTGTTIEYALPKDADVRLAVYDVLGRQVAVLEEGRRESGFHRVRWDVGDQALSSGVYFYRLRAGEKTKSGRMVLLR